MLKTLESRQVLAVVLFLALACLVVQISWEARDGLTFPDHHSPNFLANALFCKQWLLALPERLLRILATRSTEGVHLALGTGDYPPVSFMVSGVAMALFSSTVAVARTAQVLFVAGAVAAMAWLGWQVAGRRGAILLGLGMATATWTTHFVRIYCTAPAQMFILALMMALALDSEALTRTRRCIQLGLALALGMLVKYSVLLLGVPTVVLAALPRLFLSRNSKLGLLILMVLTNLVVLLTWWGVSKAESGGTGLEFPSPINAEGLMAQVLFGVALVWSVRLGGREEGSSGRGLLLIAAICGLVCSPWYFSRMELWKFLIPEQYSHAPVVAGNLAENLAAGWNSFQDHLFVLNTFYWEGAAWLASGTVGLLSWRARFRPALDLVATSLTVLTLHLTLLPPDPRYLAPMTPVLVTLAFLWAARWRATFLSCVVLMILAGLMQAAAWTPAAQAAASILRAQLVPVTSILPQSGPPPPSERPPLLALSRVPVAELPAKGPNLFKALPQGIRLGLIREGEFHHPDGLGFFVAYLKDWTTLDELSDRAAAEDQNLHALLVLSTSPETPGRDEYPAPWGNPEEFQIQVATHSFFFRIYRWSPATWPTR